jgi:hypothetical protein
LLVKERKRLLFTQAKTRYYTASEANFNEDSDSVELQSGEEEEAGMAVTGTLLGILGGPAAEE